LFFVILFIAPCFFWFFHNSLNVVYGVSVPGHDGRAGAVVLVLEDKHNFAWKKFYEHLSTQLPSYAAPLFVRVADTVEMTGTAKYRKGNLVIFFFCFFLFFFSKKKFKYKTKFSLGFGWNRFIQNQRPYVFQKR
jgi:hypothetical protein